jgi:hypothetical protein
MQIEHRALSGVRAAEQRIRIVDGLRGGVGADDGSNEAFGSRAIVEGGRDSRAFGSAAFGAASLATKRPLRLMLIAGSLAELPIEAGVPVAGLVIRARKNGGNDKSFAPPT